MITNVPGLPAFTERVEGSERAARGYLYWTPTERLGVSAAYAHENIDYGALAFSDGYAELETRRLPVSVSWFHAPRLQTRVTASLVDQRGRFTRSLSNPFAEPEPGRDRFTVVDVALSYRLPRRLGKISLEARNLFDKRFKFQDVDPENTRYFPERTLSLRLTMSY